MSSERHPVRFSIVRSEAPLRKWEALVVQHMLAVEGVQLLGSIIQDAPTAPRGKKMFRSFVQQAEGSRMLAAEENGILENAPSGSMGKADVMLFLGGSAPTDVQRQAAHCWSYMGPDGVCPNVIPPGTREALTDRPSTYFALTNGSLGGAVRSGHFTTRIGLPFTTADEVLEHASLWPAQAMREYVKREAAPLVHTDKPSSVHIPGNLAMWARRLTGALMKPRPVNDGVLGDWNIGVLHQPIHVLLDEEASMNVRWLPPPSSDKGRLEPFGYYAGEGELNVLYRKLDAGSGRSTIARLRPKPDNILKRSRAMLEIDRDHAYPYVVELDGHTHVLRTVNTEGTTGLYRTNDTNDGLEPTTTLLDVALQAPTLFQHQGQWWLMGTQEPCSNAALFIYHGPSPRGPFLPHVQNPVKCDIHSARPAGTPFVYEGALWRPALDTSDPQHPAVVFNKVTTLTKETFAEEPGRLFEGFTNTAYGRGVRTLCAMGDITLVDGLRSPVLSATEANASRGKRRKSSKKRSEE